MPRAGRAGGIGRAHTFLNQHWKEVNHVWSGQIGRRV